MFNEDIYVLKKSGRSCYMLPWGSDKLPCPWRSGYARVMIPLTDNEKLNSKKLCHIQVVKISNLNRVQSKLI